MGHWWMAQLNDLIKLGHEQAAKQLKEKPLVRENIENGLLVFLRMVKRFPNIDRKTKYLIHPMYESMRQNQIILQKQYNEIMVHVRRIEKFERQKLKAEQQIMNN